MAGKIKTREFLNMSEKDLKNKILELNKELLKMNAQRSTGTALENPGKIKLVRKTIARIKMVIHQKKLVEEKKKHE
ncbi:MAG: 50S ribosomal protein L29 [Nanoarchaeota archaeon]|nr:50S ribosomal protein L29 [Nanoarchaeota archaeon]